MTEKPSAYAFERILPEQIIRNINSFLPRPPKKKKGQISPSMQKEIMKIQSMSLNGKNAMYMRDLEDFCLD